MLCCYFSRLFSHSICTKSKSLFEHCTMRRKLNASSILWGVSFCGSSFSCGSWDLLMDDYSWVARARIGVGVVLMDHFQVPSVSFG